MIRKRLSSKQREALYQAEAEKARVAGLGDRPICNICCFPIIPPARWHESHNPFLPLALGGLTTGIAHDRCNLKHAHTRDVPLIAKVKRISEKFLDIRRSRTPFPGGRDDQIKKKITGEVVNRRTGERWEGWKT